MNYHSRTSAFLRRVLFADAIISAGAGLLMLCAAGWLEPLLALPETLLRGAGLALIPFASLVAWLAARDSAWRAGVWAVIACNALWVAGSVALLLSGQLEPNRLGEAYVIAQAVAVAVLAELEFVGLRRSEGHIASSGRDTSVAARVVD